jgi:hypothetical protein
MSMLSKIFGTGIKEVAETVVGVIDEFHVSPEERIQMNARIHEVVTERMRVVEESTRSRMEMVARVIEAEAKSGSRYTANARPTVVYVGLLIYLLNSILPMFGFAEQIQIDPNFTYAWAGVVSVWTVGRSAEKLGAFPKAAGVVTGQPGIMNRIGEL